jgi:prophage protein DUF1660
MKRLDICKITGHYWEAVATNRAGDIAQVCRRCRKARTIDPRTRKEV